MAINTFAAVLVQDNEVIAVAESSPSEPLFMIEDISEVETVDSRCFQDSLETS
jgi:hypothetical protein